MRLMVIAESSFKDYDQFKKELDSYNDLFEVLYFANAAGHVSGLCSKYSMEEMEYIPTPVWNFKGEEFLSGFSMNALLDSVRKIDQVIWFVPNTESFIGSTVVDTYSHANKPLRFVKYKGPDLKGWL